MLRHAKHVLQETKLSNCFTKSFDLPIYVLVTVNKGSMLVPNCDINSTDGSVGNNMRISVDYVS